jgi:hypothetical protein
LNLRSSASRFEGPLKRFHSQLQYVGVLSLGAAAISREFHIESECQGADRQQSNIQDSELDAGRVPPTILLKSLDCCRV